MKKIGILTFHRAENYGAALQVYALQELVNKNLGECKVIDYRDEYIEKPYSLFYFRDKKIKNIVKDFIKNILYFNKNCGRKMAFNNFLKKINLTESVHDINKCENFDVYIAGSDQIWNTEIVGELSDIYTLNFNKLGARKISYAASIGNSFIEEDMKESYKNKISQIDYISVREEDAKKILCEIINKEVNVVLDPTLLLKKEEWLEKINDETKERKKYILAYYVSPDDDFFKITNSLSNKSNLKVINFAQKNKGFKNVLKSAYTQGPLEFIKLIKNAEYIICTSFHATVFSIIFNKKFFVIPHKKTGSRVTNLLDKLGIKNRVCYTLEEFEKIDYNFETDWDAVNKKLEEERKKSIKWLENAINN